MSSCPLNGHCNIHEMYAGHPYADKFCEDARRLHAELQIRGIGKPFKAPTLTQMLVKKALKS